MYKLYEIKEGQSSMSFTLLATGNRNTLGKLINQLYNVLVTQMAGSRGKTIYAIYDINKNLVSATGPR